MSDREQMPCPACGKFCKDATLLNALTDESEAIRERFEKVIEASNE